MIIYINGNLRIELNKVFNKITKLNHISKQSKSKLFKSKLHQNNIIMFKHTIYVYPRAVRLSEAIHYSIEYRGDAYELHMNCIWKDECICDLCYKTCIDMLILFVVRFHWGQRGRKENIAHVFLLWKYWRYWISSIGKQHFWVFFVKCLCGDVLIILKMFLLRTRDLIFQCKVNWCLRNLIKLSAK